MTDSIQSGFRLSPSQRRLRALGDAAPHDAGSTCTVRIDGRFAERALATALEAIADRHEILRTRFVTPAGLEIAAQLIGRASVLRWNMQRVAPDAHELSLELPASCGDRITLRRIVAELASGGGDPAMQFADAAAWQNELLESAEAAPGRAIWTHDLDSDAAWPRIGRAAATRTIRRIATRLRMPLPHPGAALAAWHTVIHRLCRQPRLVFGLVCDGRTFPELEQALGPYTRIVPVWSRLRHDAFAACADRHERMRLRAIEWQDYFTAEQIFGDQAVQFPVQFECVPAPPAYRNDAASFRTISENTVVEPFDLRLTVETAPDATGLDLAFDPGRIDEHQAHGILQAVQRVLCGGLARGHEVVTDLALCDEMHPTGRAADAAVAADGPVTIVLDRIRRVAATMPDRVAVSSADELVTYGALLARAARIAAAIGPRHDRLVGVFLDRGVDVVAALLGAWLAGGAYVPVETGLPAAGAIERLQTSGAEVAITAKAHAGVVSRAGLRAICVDALERGHHDDGPVDAATLAYVISTSGSTGRRKAVAVEHRQLAHYVEHVTDALGLGGCTAFACVTTLAADLAHTMVFPPLALGRTLHLLPLEAVADPHVLLPGLRDEMIDCLKLVPSHLGALLPLLQSTYTLPALRRLVLGGERCPAAVMQDAADRLGSIAIFNHYGPTETTVGVLTGDRTRLDRPVGLTLASIVDDFGLEVPAGSTGELCIGGPQVARGYTNDAAATAGVFVPDPAAGAPGARRYRTGDLARVDTSGAIEILGRIDRQIKIRGYRVEPAEIERRLAEHISVMAAVVLSHEDELAPALRAYVAQRPGVTATVSELRTHLTALLPAHMIPSSFVIVDALPVTTNGKVDVARLRRLAPAAAEIVAPRSDTEARVAAVWRTILGRDAIGVDANFFELGGHSLLLLRLHQQLVVSGFTSLSMIDLFANPTVASLAAFIDGAPVPTAALTAAATRGHNLERVRTRRHAAGRTEGIA